MGPTSKATSNMAPNNPPTTSPPTLGHRARYGHKVSHVGAAHAVSLPEGPFRTDWMMATERDAITEPDLPGSPSVM